MKKFIKDNRCFWFGLLTKTNRCIKTEKALKISSIVLSMSRELQSKGVDFNKRERKHRKAIYNIIIKGKK